MKKDADANNGCACCCCTPADIHSYSFSLFAVLCATVAQSRRLPVSIMFNPTFNLLPYLVAKYYKVPQFIFHTFHEQIDENISHFLPTLVIHWDL